MVSSYPRRNPNSTIGSRSPRWFVATRVAPTMPSPENTSTVSDPGASDPDASHRVARSSSGAVHSYQAEPSGLSYHRRSSDRGNSSDSVEAGGSPGSGTAPARSSATDPSAPSIGAASAKASWSAAAIGGASVPPAARGRTTTEPRSAVGVPGAGRVVEPDGARSRVRDVHVDRHRLSRRDLAERDPGGERNGPVRLSAVGPAAARGAHPQLVRTGRREEPAHLDEVRSRLHVPFDAEVASRPAVVVRFERGPAGVEERSVGVRAPRRLDGQRGRFRHLETEIVLVAALLEFAFRRRRHGHRGRRGERVAVVVFRLGSPGRESVLARHVGDVDAQRPAVGRRAPAPEVQRRAGRDVGVGRQRQRQRILVAARRVVGVDRQPRRRCAPDDRPRDRRPGRRVRALRHDLQPPRPGVPDSARSPIRRCRSGTATRVRRRVRRRSRRGGRATGPDRSEPDPPPRRRAARPTSAPRRGGSRPREPRCPGRRGRSRPSAKPAAAPPPVHPSAASRFSTAVRADTLPRP